MRRWIACGALVACHASTPPSVEIIAPLASVPVVAGSIDEPIPPHAAHIRVTSREGSWSRAIPKATGFQVFDAEDDGRVLLTWRRGASRMVHAVPQDEDYPANHAALTDLVVRVHGRTSIIALGELSGSESPNAQSYCKNRGFATAARWEFPTEPNIVSAFSVGVPQGSSDFLIIADGGILHVLHRETSDGSCEEIFQGPLDSCEGFEYELRADIRIKPGADLYEDIVDSSAFECGEEYYGEKLSPP